jgi:hypothetical protein
LSELRFDISKIADAATEDTEKTSAPGISRKASREPRP